MDRASLTVNMLGQLNIDIVDFALANCCNKRIYLRGVTQQHFFPYHLLLSFYIMVKSYKNTPRFNSITLDTVHFYSIARDRWYEVK